MPAPSTQHPAPKPQSPRCGIVLNTWRLLHGLGLAVALLPILPLHAQLIITGEHTIEAKNNQFVPLAEAVSGDANAVLNIVGEGQVGLSAASSDFEGEIVIRGADLRLFNQGRLDRAANIVVKEGGSLTWDNTYSGTLDRFSDSGSITLSTGTLNFKTGYNSGMSEDFGPLILSSGANHITVSGVPVTISPSQILHHQTATLRLNSTYDYGLLSNNTKLKVRSTLPNTFLKGGIIPWATEEKRDNWLTAHTDQNAYWLIPFTAYHTGTPDTWKLDHNINLTQNSKLSSPRISINSLRFQGDVLTLDYTELEIVSGGLLAQGGIYAAVNGQGTITSGSDTFYVHTSTMFTLLGEVALTGISHLVKTGRHSLEFSSDAMHDLDALTINQGPVVIKKGILSVDRITIEGASLEINSNLTDAILAKTGGGGPSIALHGSHYPGHRSTLILRHNTRQQLADLYIQNRGTLSFGGSNTLKPTILYLDSLHFSDSGARLAISSWQERATYLLVKRSWGDANIPPLLNQIDFGQGRSAAWQPHDLNGFDDYWQIALQAVPEPATYGAILGAVGLGLVAWRRAKIRI